LPSRQEICCVAEVEGASDESLLALKEVALGVVALQGDKEAVVDLVLTLGHREPLGVSAQCLADMNLPPLWDFGRGVEICIFSHKYSSAGKDRAFHSLFLGTHPSLDHVDPEGHLEA